jgi:predicted RNA-binding Zn-ribbon protein involved in translation (DUF1610 family)
MFTCTRCNKNKTTYNPIGKFFDCPDCGYIEKATPINRKCFSCGKEYTEFTWFSPSSCPNCNKSFVD